jgi:hypothetical protein
MTRTREPVALQPKVPPKSVLRPRSQLLALETRTLFDGAAWVVGEQLYADRALDRPGGPVDTRSTEPAAVERGGSDPREPVRRELLFVDRSVSGWQTIVASVRPGIEVVLLDPQDDALAQIARRVGEGAPVDAVHLVTHGSEGQLNLGGLSLDLAALPGQAARLADIGSGLTADADVLLYGCEIGRGTGGAAFLAALTQATGADIAASVDATGNALAGGDWELERRSGLVETQAIAANGFASLLAAPAVTDGIVGTRQLQEDAVSREVNQIAITDTDVDNQTVTMTVLNGTIRLVDTSGLSGVTGNNSATLSFSGSLAQVNAALGINGNLLFTPSLDYNGTDARVTITTNDGTSTSAPRVVAFAITAVNDAPTLAPSALAVQEGASGVTFGPANFGVADVDITSGQQVLAQMVIEIASLPSEGTLTFNGLAVAVGSVFSQPQIASLAYSHNGANIAGGGGSDSFTVKVYDGGGGASAAVAVPIALTPRNDAPVASSAATLYEGQTKTIGLTLTDRDDALATAVSVSVTSLNAQGHGVFFLDANDNGVVDPGEVLVAGVSSFAADQSARVKFAHDGDEPDAAAPTIGFAVTDGGGGEGGGAALTTNHTVAVTVLANDDDPVPAVNTGLTGVAPGATVALGNTTLQFTDIDSTAAQLVYTLETRPQFGTLQFFDGADWKNLGVGATFTQQDIDNGKLRYDQNTQSAGATSDAFTFKLRDSALQIYDFDTPTLLREGAVRANPGDLTPAPQTFTIGLSAPNTTGLPTVPPADAGYGGNSGASGDPGNGTQPQANTGTAVVPPPGPLEGALATIPNSILNHAVLRSDFVPLPPTQVIYLVTAPSSNGTLFRDGVALGTLDRFTQDDVDNNRITWRHDGGENLVGSIAYSVSDGGPNRLFSSFGVQARPINDAPTVSGSALTIGEAVTGDPASGIGRLTTAILNLGDVDNAQGAGKQIGPDNTEGIPDALWFRVTTQPIDGALQRWDGAAWVPYVDTDLWLPQTLLTTSADGATSGLRYVHAGGDQPANLIDSLVVQVRDDLPAAVSASETRGGQTDPTLNLDPVTGRNAGGGTVQVNVIARNDPPQIAATEAAADPAVASDPGYAGAARTGANQVLTVVEGGTGDITSGFLQAVDSDNDTLQRQYRITVATAFGGINLNGVPQGAGSTFTQKDIDEGRLKYVHNGSENFADHFDFVVSDGVFATPSSRFDILVTPTNDAPTVVAPAGPVNIDSATGANNPVGAFVVADAELATLSPGESDFVQVTVRLLTNAGAAFAAADYTTGGNTTLDVTLSGAATRDADKDGVGDYLVLRGNRADVNATLASLQLTFPDDRDALYKLQVIADDRLRDGAGLLTGGANGGLLNQNPAPGGAPTAVPATELDWYAAAEADVLATDPNRAASSLTLRASSVNDAPTFTGPGAQTISEDLATRIGGFTVADSESTNSACR